MGNKVSYVEISLNSSNEDFWTVNDKSVAAGTIIKFRVGSEITFYHPSAIYYEMVYYNEETDYIVERTDSGGTHSIEASSDLVSIDAILEGEGGGGGGEDDTYHIELTVTDDAISWNDPNYGNYTYDNPALYVISCNGVDILSAYSNEGSSFSRDIISGDEDGTYVIEAYYNGVLVGLGGTTYDSAGSGEDETVQVYLTSSADGDGVFYVDDISVAQNSYVDLTLGMHSFSFSSSDYTAQTFVEYYTDDNGMAQQHIYSGESVAIVITPTTFQIEAL